jgi:hypothetical protein
LIIFAALYARTRRWDADDGTGGAMRARGRRATALPFQQLRRGALMASLAEPRASPWTATGMRDRPAGCSTCASSLCGALCGNGRSPAAGVDGLLVAIGRQGGFGAVATAAACDQHDTRRHPTTSVSSWNGDRRLHWFRSCSESVVAPAALNDHQNLAALIIFAALYARTRRARGRRATATNKAIANPTALPKALHEESDSNERLRVSNWIVHRLYHYAVK